MKFTLTTVFNFLAILLSLMLTVGVLLLGLKFYDAHLLSHRSAPSPDDDEPTMRTMEHYPFTGGHIQAFKNEREPQWPNYYSDSDVTSGEYGFFIDFHLETPPPKRDNEIRFVLTGGSAAQGWGGRTNADMFYELLPTKMTQQLQEHGQNCKVTVVNLAMGSSHLYQNFIALNKWAHPLQPDAIISFSGANEIAVPWSSKGDAPYQSASLEGGLLHVLRYSSSPHWLKVIARYYPGIVKRTVLGSLIRFKYLREYIDDLDASYYLARVDPNFRPMPREELQMRYQAALKSLTLNDIVDSVSIPLYEHAIESISRDFPGTPIFAALQPMTIWQEEYGRLISAVPPKINDEDHYYNIEFLNLQKIWQEHDFFPSSLVDPVHLSNSGHLLVARYLSNWLLPFTQDRCSRLDTAKFAPPQHTN
jgi:hypothetical protein